MDDLSQLRELEADPPPPTTKARNAARYRLLNEVAAERNRRRRVVSLPRRNWPVPRVAVAVTVVAAVVVGLTVVVNQAPRSGSVASLKSSQPNAGSVTGRSHPALAPVSAAQVLHRAAARSRAQSTSVPVPRDDQYIYTKEIIEETPVSGHGERQRFVDENWRSVDGSKPSRVSERGKSWNAPPLKKNESVWPPTKYSDLEKLPTDPDELLGSGPGGRGRPVDIRHAQSTSQDMAYVFMVDLLHGWRVMPPGLQAAAFEAVAKIPGVKVVPGEVDAFGRKGVGVTRATGPMKDQLLVFDSRTYQYLGMRDTLVRDDGVRVTQLMGFVKGGVVDRIGERP
jgi:hypothetical protein